MSNEVHDHWNPLDELTLKNQRQAYDQMREQCPVAHSEFMGWSLFRHEDIVKVLKDNDTYSNHSKFEAIPNGMDPPMHGIYRKLLDRFFEQQQMAKLEPSIREIVADIIKSMLSNEKIEFVSVFAIPFTLRSLCAFLGWPERNWEFLGGWIHGSQMAAFSKDHDAGKDLANQFSEHVKKNLDDHRTSIHNKNNATDILLNMKVDEKGFDDDQIVSILRNWIAGEGTVAASLSILIMHLANDSILQSRLRSDASLIPGAIEEILRVDGPLVANRRTTTREVKIEDRTIPKGDSVSLMWIAANRDPQVFDDPYTVNIKRNTEAGLVWGQGIHYCQGAPIARLEMRVALEELLARTKSFVLESSEINREVYPSNGLTSLQLVFK